MRVFAVLLIAATVLGTGTALGADQLCFFRTDRFTLPLSDVMPYQQWVPSQPSLTGTKYWQFSLCQKYASTVCAADGDGYAFEYEQLAGGICSASASKVGMQGWTQVGRSLNSLFMNTKNNRIFNVTLVCGPGSTLTPVSTPGYSGQGWYTHQGTNADVWVFDIILSINTLPSSICDAPTPAPQGPVPPPTPAPQTPVPGTPVTPQPPATPQPPPGPTDKPSEEEKSSSAAIIFVVLVFVLPVFYVGGTVAYNYLRLGKRGWELAPHPEFWKDFPHLCLDGCRFTKDKFLLLIGKGGSGGEEYAKI